MSLQIKRAKRSNNRLRLMLFGASGSGKTYTALEIAFGITESKKVLLIDSERGSGSDYSADFPYPYEVIELGTERVPDFSPARYLEALALAQENGYDTVIIDSLSHAWMGQGGLLDAAEKASKRGDGKKDDSYAAWRHVTPQHNKLVDAVLNYPGNIIVTLRTKTKREIVEGKIKTLGTAVVFRDGIEYEFHVTAELEKDTHILTIDKTRIASLNGFSDKFGAGIIPLIKSWQNSEDVGQGEVLATSTAETGKLQYLEPIRKAKTPEELMDIYLDAESKGINLRDECGARKAELAAAE